MKFRHIIGFAFSAMALAATSKAAADDRPYQELTVLIQDLYTASNAITAEVLNAIYHVGDSLNYTPNVNGLRLISESMDEKAASFEEASTKITEYIKRNEGKLQGSKDTIEKILSDASIDSIEIANKLSASLRQFSETTRDLEFTVYANESWANAGINVNPGDLIWVGSEGGWKVSSSYELVDWKGYTCNTTTAYNLNNNFPLGSLLYRVRGSSNQDGFALNDSKHGRIDSKGRLEFIINDNDRHNNEGQLDLHIVVFNGDAIKDLIDLLQKMKNDSEE